MHGCAFVWGDRNVPKLGGKHELAFNRVRH